MKDDYKKLQTLLANALHFEIVHNKVKDVKIKAHTAE